MRCLSLETGYANRGLGFRCLGSRVPGRSRPVEGIEQQEPVWRGRGSFALFFFPSSQREGLKSYCSLVIASGLLRGSEGQSLETDSPVTIAV